MIMAMLERLLQSQQRIERKLDAIVRAQGLIVQLERYDTMATKETLDRLAADIQANTDATAAAKDALNHYADEVANLTQQLQDAISNGDEAAIKSAADALEANNAALKAAVPTVAAAVTANTPAA